MLTMQNYLSLQRSESPVMISPDLPAKASLSAQAIPVEWILPPGMLVLSPSVPVWPPIVPCCVVFVCIVVFSLSLKGCWLMNVLDCPKTNFFVMKSKELAEYKRNIYFVKTFSNIPKYLGVLWLYPNIHRKYYMKSISNKTG